ncbi:hypothetical protein CROQUDRAFT_659247 [Cronartium quercuum f. sp. fusiforme G11]|uniref:Uncharacterized protein n=1 Tax=Cronartium quercuum f. sp. fusiforme G11 TaxID=708437 RepID=A0A9P6TAU7_9BASI|nr:hypothetical protein CROQUDRAFT_659247 [Cronartium quercuum f. sp. fusiforme G11]
MSTSRSPASISLQPYSSSSPTHDHQPLLFSVRPSHQPQLLDPLSQSRRSSISSDSGLPAEALWASASSSSPNKHFFLRSHQKSRLYDSDQPRQKWKKTRSCLAFSGLGALFYTIYALWSWHRQISQSLAALAQPARSNLPSEILSTSKLPAIIAPLAKLCEYCDCSVNRTSPPPFPITKDLPVAGSQADVSFQIWASIRDTYCQHAYLSEGSALDLLVQTDLSQNFRSILQWNLSPLAPSLPTAYLFTKTSTAGRTMHQRAAYFKRHILTIRTHLEIMKSRSWPTEGAQARWGSRRQLIWIVIEDGEKLSSDVAHVLAASGLPYVYWCYGPTRRYGNAQQNAAYSIIHKLSETQSGIFGHGPVLSIDDDSNILPELLEIIWGVVRIGIWPMGNLGPNGWEGPSYDEEHKLVSWEAGAVEDREFPVDNGAFAFSSDLLGEVLKGPKYWPTDFSGGENEFISLIIKTKEELEPLCYNCHVAWHNEPLPRECTIFQLCD